MLKTRESRPAPRIESVGGRQWEEGLAGEVEWTIPVEIEVRLQWNDRDGSDHEVAEVKATRDAARIAQGALDALCDACALETSAEPPEEERCTRGVSANDAAGREWGPAPTVRLAVRSTLRVHARPEHAQAALRLLKASAQAALAGRARRRARTKAAPPSPSAGRPAPCSGAGRRRRCRPTSCAGRHSATRVPSALRSETSSRRHPHRVRHP